jgi:hypothetical protein
MVFRFLSSSGWDRDSGGVKISHRINGFMAIIMMLLLKKKNLLTARGIKEYNSFISSSRRIRSMTT